MLVGSAYAAKGTLTGSVTGMPSEVSSEVVEAVSPQGVIGGVGTVSPAGAYKLKLAPGTWIVTASALSGDSALASAAPPLRVRPGHVAHGRPAQLKTQAVASAARGLPSGTVVTVAPIIINDERGPVFNLKLDYTALVTNDLFEHCSSRGIVFVDTSEAFRKFAQQELALSRSGRLATPFVYKPIAPKYRIETEFNEVDRSGINIGFAVHKPGDTETGVSGALTAEGEVKMEAAQLETGPTDGEVLNLVNKEAGILAERMCG